MVGPSGLGRLLLRDGLAPEVDSGISRRVPEGIFDEQLCFGCSAPKTTPALCAHPELLFFSAKPCAT